MAGVPSERVPMSPQEAGSRNRRLARYYRDGMSMQRMKAHFGIGADAITSIIRTEFPDIPLREAKVPKPKAGA